MNSAGPDAFAYLALVAWPLVSAFFYWSRSFFVATLLTVLAAQLLLPSGAFFKFPMVPQLDKITIPAFCILIAFLVTRRPQLPFRRSVGICEFLIVASVFAPVVTSVLNLDPIYAGPTLLPGVGLYDGFSAALFQFVVLTPFIVGRLIVKSATDLITILKLLAAAGLAYSLPLLFEVRFSPQLHAWVYGFYPSDFIQTIREDGGFRPMVFFGHGLLASFFVMTTVVAATALWRAGIRFGQISWGALAGYLGFVLVLCKSSAALAYGLFAAPLVRWAKPRTQLRIAMLLAVVALTYPATRMLQIFPTNTIVDVASTLSPSRASSLKFRFDQEDALVERAFQRPIFGWGRYGRNRIYTDNWRGEAVDTSVTDGRWIITFGQFGLVGFLLEFGLLALPIFRASTAIKNARSGREAIAMAAIALVAAINMIELLPNSTLSPWTWLMAGCLLGCSEVVSTLSRSRRSAPYLSSSSPIADTSNALARKA
jgi:hypothetical protein